MSTGQEIPAESGVNYLNANYGIKSWLLTFDHKRIGLGLGGRDEALGERRDLVHHAPEDHVLDEV